MGTNPYDLAYTYDAGGNRLTKIDRENDLLVEYEYDYTDPATFGSDNNRLMFYETFDTSGPQNILLETTWYFYNASGNPTRIVTSAAGSDDYSATLFSYAKNGSAVAFVLGETWTESVSCGEEQAYTVTYAREFRYDTARARYLNRELDTSDTIGIMADPIQYNTLSATWSDYDGDENYGDFTVDGAVATDERSFEPGLATVDPWAGSGGASTKHFTTNHLGTTRGQTNSSGTAVESATYTAFGERIDGTNHRYGYAGAWGYQAHDDFPYVHVGARYYDPATGRFLQRDPIGIGGGLNVYAYVGVAPTAGIDPDGLAPIATFDYIGPRFQMFRPDPPGGPESHQWRQRRNHWQYKRRKAEAEQWRWSLPIWGTDWIEDPIVPKIQRAADIASWGCAIPIGKMPTVFRWARWIWGGIQLLL